MITAAEAKAETADRASVVAAAVADLLTQIQPKVCEQAAQGFSTLTLNVNATADVLEALRTTLAELGYVTSGDAANFSMSWA